MNSVAHRPIDEDAAHRSPGLNYVPLGPRRDVGWSGVSQSHELLCGCIIASADELAGSVVEDVCVCVDIVTPRGCRLLASVLCYPVSGQYNLSH